MFNEMLLYLAISTAISLIGWRIKVPFIPLLVSLTSLVGSLTMLEVFAGYEFIVIMFLILQFWITYMTARSG